MKILKNLFASTIVVVALGFAFYNFYDYFQGPCDGPIKYSIGRLDKEFGISEEYFKKQIEKAGDVWEKSLNREIFIYDPSADLSINLIYDERQLATLQKQRTEYGLSNIEATLKVLDDEFNMLKQQYELATNLYQKSEKNFETKQAKYESEVSFWNVKGGAPEKEYWKLNNEAISLKNEAERLSNEASVLNQKAKELNILLEERNRVALAYNKLAKSYNEKYGHGLEFNQGEYNGQQINIYQFIGEAELQMVLIHELGHALGMNHVEDRNSIMYYLIESGSKPILELSPADLAELKKVCNLK